MKYLYFPCMILIWFSCWKLGEKFGFAELGQCILQQDNTFMREEKLEKYFEVEGIVPSAHGNTEGYSMLAIKNQQPAPLPGVEPGTSCTEICHSSLWAIVARLFRSTKNLHHVLVAFHDRSSEDFKWSLALPGVEPGTSCTEICHSSLWAIVARLFRSTKNLHHVLVAFHDRSSEDFKWSLARSALSRSTF